MRLYSGSISRRDSIPSEVKATVCRSSAGECDLAESCTGAGAACPTDAKSTDECRAGNDECDAAESCDGVGNDCPAGSP